MRPVPVLPERKRVSTARVSGSFEGERQGYEVSSRKPEMRKRRGPNFHVQSRI